MKKESISLLLVALTFGAFAEFGCFYDVGSGTSRRECGKRREKNSLYCSYHKKIKDEENRKQAKREVEEEYRQAKAAREAQTQMMAEGVARALGRTICLAPGCKNYAPEGQRYCSSCQEDMAEEARRKELKTKVKEYNDSRYDSIMASLQQCKATNPDGTPCRHKANPGMSYCFRHVGFDKGASPAVVQKPTDPKDITSANMKELEEAIIRYKKATKGSAPSTLDDLRQLSAAVPSFKDGWGTPFYYETDGENFGLSSAGPDKKFETSDDITIIRQK